MSNFIKIISRSISGITLLFAIFIPFVMNIFCSNTVLLDNRPLYEKPKVFSASFFKDYERYYNDTIAYRSDLISLYSRIYSSLSMLQGIYFDGKKNYMFLNTKDSLDDYFGIDFSESEKSSIRNYINKISQYCENNNIRYLFVSVPNKEEVYSEFMPDVFKKDRLTSKSRVDRILDEIGNKYVLNLKSVLLKFKNDNNFPIYYKKDTHWNDLGAYIGFREIMNNLYTIDYEFYIDTIDDRSQINTTMGGYPFWETRYSIVNFLKNINVEKICDDGRYRHYRTKNALVKKKLLVIRDSFSTALTQYFIKVFSEVILVHWQNIKNSISEIEKYHPDIVIDQTVERYVLYRSKL